MFAAPIATTELIKYRLNIIELMRQVAGPS